MRVNYLKIISGLVFTFASGYSFADDVFLGKYQCPNDLKYDGVACVLADNVGDNAGVFEYSGLIHILLPDSNLKCPSNTIDNGVFSNGRHCNTGYYTRDHAANSKNKKIYITPTEVGRRCPESTTVDYNRFYDDKELCLVADGASEGSSYFQYDGYWVLLNDDESFVCPSSTSDHGIFDNGRHCGTRLETAKYSIEKIGQYWYSSMENIPFSTEYEIVDIRVNPDSSNSGRIYANGNMQYRIDIDVLIKDADYNNVFFRDKGTAIDVQENGRDLVTLYLKNKGADVHEANLSIDNVGYYSNPNWKASRVMNKYDKTMLSRSLNFTNNEGYNEDDSYLATGYGYNRYTYWITTDLITEGQKICARIGTYGYYKDSCLENNGEFAEVTSVKPVIRLVGDFEKDREMAYQDAHFEVNHLTYKPRNFSILDVEFEALKPASTEDGIYVAWANDSWNVPVAQSWNSNASLIYFDETYLNEQNLHPGISYFHSWSRSKRYTRPIKYEKGALNFIDSVGDIFFIGGNNNKGGWTGGYPKTWSSLSIDGRVDEAKIKVTDNYGTVSELSVKTLKSGWFYQGFELK